MSKSNLLHEYLLLYPKNGTLHIAIGFDLFTAIIMPKTLLLLWVVIHDLERPFTNIIKDDYLGNDHTINSNEMCTFNMHALGNLHTSWCNSSFQVTICAHLAITINGLCYEVAISSWIWNNLSFISWQFSNCNAIRQKFTYT